ncbi:MAG TPA: glutamate racemase [Candidatus Sumerlaeota bacterium]|nr:MAG: Glutamate racemase [candidate division BRC1 bacterium ADurb.BinA292]HOE95512.1 glutamate racemase [Candidatus Sumerlaeota bacterium]HOR28870.1 glutamate racemase [Candidatus Sumerlaeota bacterium]HPK02648.1 glutamate racemase [Candidatus Sumerlaeota bacterium]
MRLGVFDSGIGGLTVLRAIRRRWPGHATVYLGDTARVPYGIKSRQTVIHYARQNTRLLLAEAVDLLVIACNTASAFALEALRDLPVPVVGVIEPGAAAAVGATRSGRIGVIGTAATIASGAYEAAIRRLAPAARVSSRACPLLVPLAEEGWETTAVARATLERYLEGWLPAPASDPETPDVLVLGCTHYPVFKPLLSELLGPGITLIDSADAVAAALAPWLDAAPPEPAPGHRLLVTDAADGFARAARRLLGETVIDLQVVDLLPAVADKQLQEG